jgi:alpha-beta hydrolase superfamily lysophospholipase
MTALVRGTRVGRAAARLVLLLSLASGVPAGALKPSRIYRARPGDYGIIVQEVTFLTADSLRLAGWFYPAQDTAGISNDMVGRVAPVPEHLRPAPRPYRARDEAPSDPTIVICDGDAGNMADLILYAYNFFTRGFNVFTFDWRGFGGSADWPMAADRLCCTEFLRDYDAALDYLEARPEVDPGALALLGFSTGAYLSFAALATHPEVRAFAGRALLTSFADLLPILARVDLQRGFTAPSDYPPELLPVHAAPDIEAAVLLIAGEHDERTPPWMSQRILELLPGPKELWIVAGAEHGGARGPELANYPEFFQRVATFFGQHL